MTHIGLQQPGTKWIRWFTLMQISGLTLVSCNNVGPDVVFTMVDAGDSGSETDGDVGSDGEIAILDSGSKIPDRGRFNPDGTVPNPLAGFDGSNLFPSAFEYLLEYLQCPDDEALPIDNCTMMTSEFQANAYGRLNLTVESKEACIPPNQKDFVENLDTSSESLSDLRPCPQICKAIEGKEFWNLPMILSFGLNVYLYYADPDDPNTLLACPLTCEALRCGDALRSQMLSMIFSSNG